MIHLFSKARFKFPIKWANAVTKWLVGLKSDGSINIANTMNPTEDSGPTISVNRGWLKKIIAANSAPYPARNLKPETVVAPEDWEGSSGQQYGEEKTDTNGDKYYSACGTSWWPAAADHRHKSDLAPTSETATDDWMADTSSQVGESKYAARLDHKHKKPTAKDITYSDTQTVYQAINMLKLKNSSSQCAKNLVVYQIYKPNGSIYITLVPYTLTIVKGIITQITKGTEVSVSNLTSPNVPTLYEDTSADYEQTDS